MKSRTILMGYGDDVWVGALSTFYRNAGYRVENAVLVSDMIRTVRSDSVDVILLEDEIEGVKACDLVPVLKKINGMVQVIVISSEGSLGSARRLRGAGIFFQTMKPVDLEEIKSAVECAFQKIRREQAFRQTFVGFVALQEVPA
jgi:DNA-binding NtrC family response regulator